MDNQLESSWRDGRSPFNGETLFLPQPVALSVLVPLLTVIVRELQDTYPTVSLRKLDDWHEHDGICLPSEPTTWSALQACIASPSSLRATISDDTHVRLAICDGDAHFYLRFGLEGAGTGVFDLSGPCALVRDVRRQLPYAPTSVANAKSYFDDIYAGP